MEKTLGIVIITMKVSNSIIFLLIVTVIFSCKQQPKELHKSLRPLCNWDEYHPNCSGMKYQELPVLQGQFQIDIMAHKDSVFFLENQHLSVGGRFKHKMNEKENNFNEFLRFISNNLKYPEMEREAGIQGSMYFQINLDKKNICGIPEVLKSVSPGLKKEALRVLNMLKGSSITTHPIKTTYLIIKIKCVLVD